MQHWVQVSSSKCFSTLGLPTLRVDLLHWEARMERWCHQESMAQLFSSWIACLDRLPTSIRLGLDHIFIRLGPTLQRLLHYPVFLPAPTWELFPIGNQYDNTQSKLQIFKLSSLSLFSSWLMEFLHMPKELNGSNGWVLSHWLPTRKSSHAGACKKTRRWRRRGRDRNQLNEDVV